MFSCDLIVEETFSTCCDCKYADNSGDVPRVDGQLAVARAFGDRSLKVHLSSEPFINEETIDEQTDFLILASDGLWKVFFHHNYALVNIFLVLCNGYSSSSISR